MTTAQKDDASQLASAPARFLDQFEELRMELSNEQLIAEAIRAGIFLLLALPIDAQGAHESPSSRPERD